MRHSAPTEPVALLESLRFDPGTGYVLLEAHLDRLERSAAHFGYPFNRGWVLEALAEPARTCLAAQKVRLLLDASGALRTEAEPVRPSVQGLRVVLARSPIDPADPYLYHKTTRRAVYEEALAEAAEVGAGDVILWNSAGEVTEASSSNVVVRLDGELVTPPVSVGLLPGTFRGALLAQGFVREHPVGVADLAGASGIYLVNSVRGWRRAVFEPRQI